MARMVMVKLPDGTTQLLAETQTQEKPLQLLVRDHPDLLPINEFGMQGPLLVVGRETSLPSGSIDLVAIARSGELLLIEFKTGPQNPDFRAVLAQLLDYGSDLWGMTADQFEQGVAVRFFQSPHCEDPTLKGCRDLHSAMQHVWPDMGPEDESALLARLAAQLTAGNFSYIAVAQRFTPVTERTIEYMNHVASGSRFYAVELVAFEGGPLAAFEARALARPTKSKAESARVTQSVEGILATVEPAEYAQALRDLVSAAAALGFRFEPGSVGFSIRLQTSDRPEPLTIAWVYPPGKPGWLGLRDASFGFDTTSSVKTPTIEQPLETYINTVVALPGALAAKSPILKAFTIPPEGLIQHHAAIAEAWGRLAESASNGV